MVRIIQQRTTATRLANREQDNRIATKREYAEQGREYNKAVETQNIISKYGVDIRKYQNNFNYNINKDYNGNITSIIAKPQTYDSNVTKYYRDKGDSTSTKQSTFQPEKIIFQNGKAVAKEYYTIGLSGYESTSPSSRGSYRREYDYKPVLQKKEYFNSNGQVIKDEVYNTYIKKSDKGSSSKRYIYDVYKAQENDYVQGQGLTYTKPRTKKSSSADKVKTIQVINGKTYTVTTQASKLRAGDKLYQDGKVTVLKSGQEINGNIVKPSFSYKPPISQVGLSQKEKKVRELLINTGQDASSLATIKAIAKSNTMTRSLEDKFLGKRDLANELKEEFKKTKFRQKYFSDIITKINYNNWSKSLSKKEAISLLSNYTNLNDPKYPGLKNKLISNSPLDKKEALKMAREGWINPNTMIALSGEANRQNIYNTYFKKENVSYWYPEKREFIIVQITPDFRVKTITGILGTGKVEKQDQIIQFSSNKALKIASKVAMSRIGDSIYSSIKNFGTLNRESRFDTLTPFSSNNKVTTVSYNQENKKYTTIEINPKTGKTLKTTKTTTGQAWNRLNALQAYLIKKTIQTVGNIAFYIDNSFKNTINIYNYAVTKDSEEKYKKIAEDLDKKGLKKTADEYYKKALNSRIKSFDYENKLKIAKRKGEKILKNSTIVSKTLIMFTEKFLRGAVSVGASLSYISKGLTETMMLINKRNKLDRNLKKLSKKGKIDKISITSTKFTNETTKLADEIVKQTNQYTKLLDQYTKTYNLAKSTYYSDDAKLFKEVIKWATIFKILGGISQLSNISKTIGQVRVPLPQRQIAVGTIGIRGLGTSAKLGMYGIEGKFAQDQYNDFVRNPTPGRLALALFYASSILVSSIRSVKKFSSKYIPTIREVDTTLKLYKSGHIPAIKRVLKEYKAQLIILKRKPKINRLKITKITKDISRATKDLAYLENQVLLFEQIIKDPLKLQSGLLNRVAPVKQWMKDLWKRADKKVPTQLIHVSPEKASKLLKSSYKTETRRLLNFENAQEKRIYDAIMKKAGAKISNKKPGNIIPKNELEKVALPIFKRKKVVIGGGRALNTQVSWFRKRTTPDLDAKIIRGAKSTLEEIANKANKLYGNKYKVLAGGHKGTFKIINIKTKQTLIELTSSQSFFKILKKEKVGRWLVNKQGLLIESIPSLLKGKANALSKIDRLYRKSLKDIGDVFRLTKGAVGSKLLNKIIKTQKGEFVVSGIERFGQSFLGKKRRKLSKGAKVPIDPMYWSTRAETYYSKPNLGFLKIKPQEGTMLVYDASSLSKFSPTIQKKWYRFFDNGGSKQTYNSLIGETQRYVNRNPNKFFSGYPKSNTLVDEAEILLAKNSILKYNEQRFFTYVDGQKFSVVKVGFATPKRMSIVDIFKETLPKYKGRELLYRLDDVNYQRSILSLKDYITKTNSKPGLKIFNSLKLKVKKLTGKSLLDIFKKGKKTKILTKTTKKTQQKLRDVEEFTKKLGKEFDRVSRNIKRNKRTIIPVSVALFLKTKRKYYSKSDIRKLKTQIDKTRIKRVIKRTPRGAVRRSARIEIKRTPRIIKRQSKRKSRVVRKPTRRAIKRIPRRVVRRPTRRTIKRKPITTRRTSRRVIKRIPIRIVRRPVRIRKPRAKEKIKIPLPTNNDLKKYNKVDIYVKIKGQSTKYIRINSGYLTYKQAIMFGRYITDNSRIASYDKRKSTLKTRLKFNVRTLAKKFRKPSKGSKLPRTASVEKRKYRSDTLGEKRDLKIAKLRKARSQKAIVSIVKGKKKNKTVKKKKTRRKTTKKRKK